LIYAEKFHHKGVGNMAKVWGVLLGCAMFLGMIGCGGSSSSSTAIPTPTPGTGTATVSASSTTIPLSAVQQFTASNFSAAVTWSLNPAIGSIDANGRYTAPATFPSPTNTVAVTATAGTQVASVNATIVYPNDNGASQTIPVKLGTSGGNVNDQSPPGPNGVCCIGTMGSLWTRADLAQPVILSNNHVLARSSLGVAGESITQPGPSACFPAVSKPIATLTQQAALAPAGTAQGRTGPAPSNTDSAIAQIVPGTVDLAGTILDLGAAGASSIAAAAPSNQLPIPQASIGMPVAKSGRTTGLTCSTVESINMTIPIAYDISCTSDPNAPKAFTATYTNQVMINGGSFSAGGDSGSLIVRQTDARPVALLYGGSPVDTVANPIQDVITALSSGANTLTLVGGGDHAVSCSPEASANSTKVGAAATTVPLSATERQRVTSVQQQHSRTLMQDSAVSSVAVGGSVDSRGEGALVIHLAKAASTPIPAVIDGVRTRIIYDGAQPSIGQAQVDHATAAKEAHVDEYIGQPGIQAVGVTISADNPAETAVSIYVIQGTSHQVIPPMIDGIRTRIFEGPQIRPY
jgi:hypothetical protein